METCSLASEEGGQNKKEKIMQPVVIMDVCIKEGGSCGVLHST